MDKCTTCGQDKKEIVLFLSSVFECVNPACEKGRVKSVYTKTIPKPSESSWLSLEELAYQMKGAYPFNVINQNSGKRGTVQGKKDGKFLMDYNGKRDTFQANLKKWKFA